MKAEFREKLKTNRVSLIVGGVSVAVLVVTSILMYFYYTVRPLDLYGQTVRADATEYTLTEDVKVPFDELVDALRQLRHLKKLDLGGYAVDVRDEPKLRAAFPDAELTYTTCVGLYGLELDPDTEELDLSDRDISDLTPLREAIPYLKKLTRVSSTGNVLTREELDALNRDFPAVTFRMVCEVNAFGKTYRDNLTVLDLTGVTLSGDLAEALRQFPDLEEVNLRGKSFSTEEQLALAAAFPDVAFAWDVALLGRSYDSFVEELDLSKNKNATPDLMRRMAPLFPRLKRLDMSECGASDEEMARLREDLPDVKVVWRIYMGKWSLKTDAVAFSVLIGDYTHTRLKSKDIEVLKYCTDLQALDLGHQAITDISVIGDYLQELRLLVLVDNQVSDLGPVAKLKHLHYIELFVNSHLLTDLTPLASCRELVDVNVSYLYGVTDFSPLFDLPLLERLWMEHTKISAEQLATIKARYPNATIITQGEGSIDNGWRTHERYYAAWGPGGMFHDPNCTELREEFKKYDQ